MSAILQNEAVLVPDRTRYSPPASTDPLDQEVELTPTSDEVSGPAASSSPQESKTAEEQDGAIHSDVTSDARQQSGTEETGDINQDCGSNPLEKEEPSKQAPEHVSETDQAQNDEPKPPAETNCPKTNTPHSILLDFGIKECPSCSINLRESQNVDGANRLPEGSTADLYCDIVDKPHAALLEFGITSCPYCYQRFVPSDSNPSTTNGPSMSHSVEYRDIGGYRIDSTECGYPFELERERQEVLHKKSTDDDQTIFRLLTVLKTSVPPETSMSHEAILNNPRLSITQQEVRMTILSPIVIHALKKVVTYETGALFDSGRLELNEPYALIGHHLQELENYTKDFEPHPAPSNAVFLEAATQADVEKHTVGDPSEKEETYSHMRFFLDFAQKVLNDPIAEEQARYRKDPPMCTFRMLSYLFRPDTLVYLTTDDQEDAYMVYSAPNDNAGFSSPFESLESYRVKMWNLEFDGVYITRASRAFYIKPFEGEKPIMSLNVVPCHVRDAVDGGTLRNRLEERGEKWVDHLQGKQIVYKGEPIKSGSKRPLGRGYVDFVSYYEEHSPSFDPLAAPENPPGGPDKLPDCNCSICKPNKPPAHEKVQWGTYDKIPINELEMISHPSLTQCRMFLLCSRNLKAFMFNTRTWETIDVSYCTPSEQDDQPFDRLVLPKGTKDLIKALVYKFTDPTFAGEDREQVWGADFINNKGKGQIFLLHGGPGTGKTFTAECIAELTGRPLLPLTCGDLGTEETQLEQNLKKWLKLAHSWGAVMLLDEADVFLEKREEHDLKRNSLVSVFLREIEYYQGILFLTSNRVGLFDDAIVSRIHVVISFPDLNAADRKAIWEQFFDKLKAEKGKVIKIDERAVRYVLEDDNIAKGSWNGREIRNAFQTAVALAEYRFIALPAHEKKKGKIAELKAEHFQEVCELTVKFKQYLQKVHGIDEQKRAINKRIRA